MSNTGLKSPKKVKFKMWAFSKLLKIKQAIKFALKIESSLLLLVGKRCCWLLANVKSGARLDLGGVRVLIAAIISA